MVAQRYRLGFLISRAHLQKLSLGVRGRIPGVSACALSCREVSVAHPCQQSGPATDGREPRGPAEGFGEILASERGLIDSVRLVAGSPKLVESVAGSVELILLVTGLTELLGCFNDVQLSSMALCREEAVFSRSSHLLYSSARSVPGKKTSSMLGPARG